MMRMSMESMLMRKMRIAMIRIKLAMVSMIKDDDDDDEDDDSEDDMRCWRDDDWIGEDKH